VPPDTRDAVVDFVNRWSEKREIPVGWFIPCLGIRASKYYYWSHRYGKVNEHNGWIPRDYWLEEWERQAIIAFHLDHPLEGYRRLTFMMLDADVVAVSPTSVWRVLSGAGLLGRWNVQPSKKGTGFIQPLGPQEHWHVGVLAIKNPIPLFVRNGVQSLHTFPPSKGIGEQISEGMIAGWESLSTR
jgi:putative transposase